MSRLTLLLTMAAGAGAQEPGLSDAMPPSEFVTMSSGAPWVEQETAGCFYLNAKYDRAQLKSVTNPVKFIHSALECQQMCQRANGCTVFGYFQESQTCYLSGDGGLLEWSPGAVSGPARCPQVPSACTALPAAGQFPGATPEQSAAAWPAGGNPTKLQCWPWNEYNQPAYCHAERVTVLDSKQTAGRCLGLTKVELPGGESCEMNCARNVLCPSWQEVIVPSTDGKSSTVECWQGVGRDCFFQRELVSQNAGRFMHGHYRVLANLQHVQVMGLQKVFDAKDNKFASHAEAIRHCNHTCLSLLTCEVWQYSTDRGCYIEDPVVRGIDYPPTTESWRKDTPFAQTAIAGQYIQRLCGRPGGSGVPVPPPVPAPPAPAPATEEPTTAEPIAAEPTTAEPTTTTTTQPTTTTSTTQPTTLPPSTTTLSTPPPTPAPTPAPATTPAPPPTTPAPATPVPTVAPPMPPAPPVPSPAPSRDVTVSPSTTQVTTTKSTTTMPWRGRFVTSGQEVWWQDPFGNYRHMVPPTLNCDHCQCRGALTWVDDAYLEQLDTGDTFDCSMIPPSPVPLRGRFVSSSDAKQTLYWQENAGILHPVGSGSQCAQCGCHDVVAVDAKYMKMLPRGDVFNCSMIPQDTQLDMIMRAQGPLSARRAALRQALWNMPWWGWVLIASGTCVLISLCCLGYLFFCMTPQERKRSARMQAVNPLLEGCSSACANEASSSEDDLEDGEGEDEKIR